MLTGDEKKCIYAIINSDLSQDSYIEAPLSRALQPSVQDKTARNELAKHLQ